MATQQIFSGGFQGNSSQFCVTTNFHLFQLVSFCFSTKTKGEFEVPLQQINALASSDAEIIRRIEEKAKETSVAVPI
jgi:hypothetical protein